MTIPARQKARQRPLCKYAVALFTMALAMATRTPAGEFILPGPAAEALRAMFPKARITDVGRERERGAWYYEVTLKDGTRRFEAEVTAEGVIGEVESVVRFGDVPGELQQLIRQRVGNGRLRAVEKHERHGIARSGRFAPLKAPRIVYEVKYVTAAGERREFQVASNEVLELPGAVLEAVRAAFPNATLSEAEAEADDGVMVFAVTLKTAGGLAYAAFSREGRLLEKEVPMDWADAPSAVARAMAAETRPGDGRLLLKRETLAAVENGEIVGRHDTAYLVRLTRGARMREFTFDGAGRQVHRSDWTAESHEDDDDEDDDEDE